MTTREGIFKCASCGNLIEVLHASGGDLVCCGQPMKPMVENTVEASKEKHIPVVERVANGIKVTVGSVLHPMEEKHFIEWIEICAGDSVYRRYLKPGAAPSAVFEGVTEPSITVREYCNLHGVWKA